MVRHVIIVTHNNEPHIRACLDALPAAWQGRPYHVTLVDNASQDRTVSIVEHTHPEVRVLPLRTNTGFAQAVHRAYSPKATMTLLLNPDTVPLPGSLARLEETLNSWPTVGAVGPALVSPDGRIDPRSARSFPSLWREFMDKLGVASRYPNSLLTGRYYMGTLKTLEPVPVLSGAAILIRGQAWRAVNGLDTRFWLYAEDTDFCKRLWQAGWMCVYTPQARVIHVGSGSVPEQERLSLGIIALDSMYNYMVKHHGPVYGLLYRGLLMLVALIKSIYWALRLNPYHLQVQRVTFHWAWTRAHWK